MSLIRYGGYANNSEIAHRFTELLIKECGLHSGSRVLDIGCGAGIIDGPILKSIGPTGKLCGLDIIKESVHWCQKTLQRQFPNSEFKHASIFNANYNPSAQTPAQDYQFPYPDNAFDVVLLKSVFTHMRPAEVKNYLLEMARMMVPGAHALMTFFVLNHETRTQIAEGKSMYNFSHEFEGCMIVNKDIQEDAIAYEYDVLKQMFEDSGLKLKKVLLGGWRGLGPTVDQAVTGQDVIILERC